MPKIVRYGGKLYSLPDTWSQEQIVEHLRKTAGESTSDAAPETPPTSRLRALGSGLLQGATLGFSDEIAGALGGDTEAWRSSQRQHASRHPGFFHGGQIAGGLAGMGAAAAAMPVAGATGGLGTGMTALRAAAPRLAALGAAEGAVAGAGYSDSEGRDRAADAGVGAATGAVLGPLLPGLAWGGRAAVNRMRPRNRAALAVNRGLQESGVDPAAAQRRLDANPAMVVADTAPDTQQQLGTLSRRAGDTPAAVERSIVPRNVEQVDRFERVFADALGGTTVPEARAASQTARREAAQRLYGQAYETPIELTPRIREVLRRPSARRAFKSAFDMVDESLDPQIADSLKTFRQGMQVRVEGMEDAAQKAFSQARKRGNLAEMMRLTGVEAVPSPVMDYLGRVMRQQGDTQLRGGRPGGHITMSLRRRLMGEIDAQNPALAEARGVWAGAKADEEALDFGRKALTETGPEFRSRFDGMSASEQDHVRVGIFESLMDRMKGSSDDPGGDVRRLVNNRKAKEMLSLAFGDDEKYAGFLRMLDDETAMSGTARATRAQRTDTAPGDMDANLPFTRFLILQRMAKELGKAPIVQGPMRRTRDLTGAGLLGRQVPPLPARTPMTPLMRAMSAGAGMGWGPER